MLTRLGFDVRWSIQASQARSLAGVSPADVLLVDVNLVTASGIEVAQQLFHDNLVASVLFMTGSVDMDQADIPTVLRDKSKVLHKPVDKEMLLNAIATLSAKASEPGKSAT